MPLDWFEFLSSIEIHLLDSRKNVLSTFESWNGEKKNMIDFLFRKWNWVHKFPTRKNFFLMIQFSEIGFVLSNMCQL